VSILNHLFNSVGLRYMFIRIILVMGMGVGKGRGILAKQGCFLSFEWKKTNFTTLDPPPWKILDKIL